MCTASSVSFNFIDDPFHDVEACFDAVSLWPGNDQRIQISGEDLLADLPEAREDQILLDIVVGDPRNIRAPVRDCGR